MGVGAITNGARGFGGRLSDNLQCAGLSGGKNFPRQRQLLWVKTGGGRDLVRICVRAATPRATIAVVLLEWRKIVVASIYINASSNIFKIAPNRGRKI
jgi:hypothetical protein